MHCVIIGEKWIDHIDENGLNHHRWNLRRCTNAQNQQSTGSRGGRSCFKGVSWVESKGSWEGGLQQVGKRLSDPMVIG